MRNSTGGRANDPVMNRLVTTVYIVVISFDKVRENVGMLSNYLDGSKNDTQNGKEESGV